MRLANGQWPAAAAAAELTSQQQLKDAKECITRLVGGDEHKDDVVTEFS